MGDIGQLAPAWTRSNHGVSRCHRLRACTHPNASDGLWAYKTPKRDAIGDLRVVLDMLHVGGERGEDGWREHEDVQSLQQGSLQNSLGVLSVSVDRPGSGQQ